MCTAVTYKTKDFYFGRTLDCESSYGEEIVVTPRNYVLHFREKPDMIRHYAMIGMAHVAEDYPLYYEAVNEKGLGVAGLNFVGNAHYNSVKEGKDNIAQFEVIPWILGQCANVDEALVMLSRMNITNVSFSGDLPVAQLHWMIADRNRCVTVEAVRSGLKVYLNPTGTMTNNPTFDKQLFNLNNYLKVSPDAPENGFSNKIMLNNYSRGMGGLGLPGDLSSMSRFVRVSFVKLNSFSKADEMSSVSQFFHILNSVDQQRGCCRLHEDKYEITSYSSCCNTATGVYYYTTYDNHQISAVDMRKEDLDSNGLVVYPLVTGEQVRYQN